MTWLAKLTAELLAMVGVPSDGDQQNRLMTSTCTD
jgi:hypothetical protein